MSPRLLLLACALLPASPTLAAGPSMDSVLAGPSSGQSGATHVNLAAGSLNQQANVAALANAPGGVALALGNVVQRREDDQASLPASATARIAGAAFAGATGLVAVNQSSGSRNAQANIAAIAMGAQPHAVSERVLESSAAGPAAPTAGEANSRVAVSEAGAFAGARGVIQVNQAAGAGNATANVFALRYEADALRRQ